MNPSPKTLRAAAAVNRGRRQAIAGLAASAALPFTLAAGPAAAQDAGYPSRTIRIVVPFGAGSATDTQVRLLLPKLSEVLGQQVVIENIPGATGVIGSERVARSAPDGYTLLVGTNATHATLQSMTKVPYVVMRDFSFIGRISTTPAFVVINNDIPAKTLPEFIAWAKKQPQGVSYATTGPGGSAHLASELIGLKTGIKVVHVPYKEGGRAVADLIGGQVQMMSYFASVLPQVKAGKLKGLAVLAESRSPSAPDLPTAAEQGIPGIDVAAWAGVFAPAALPVAIRDKLWAAFDTTLKDPKVREQWMQQGVEAVPLGTEAFRRYCEQEAVRWAEIVRATNLKMD